MSVQVSELEVQVQSNIEGINKELDKLIDKISQVQTKMGGLSKKAEAVNDGLGETKQGTADLTKETKKANDSMGKSGEESGKVSENAKKVNKSIKGTFKGTTKFFASLKRVAFYRMIRKILSTIANGFKEGTTNAYLFAKAMNMSVAKKLDNISTELLYFKNQLGAIGVQFLASFEPIITKIVDGIAVATTYLSKLFAVLNGGHEYLVATKNAKAFAKAQRDLMGFDELNKLSGDSTNNMYSFETQTISNDEYTKLQSTLGIIENIALAIGSVVAICIVLKGVILAIKSIGAILSIIKFASAITLLIAGISAVIYGLKEWITTGEISNKALLILLGGILAIGGAIALLVGGWIPLAIAVVAALATFIVAKWDIIKEWAINLWNVVKEWSVNLWNNTKAVFVKGWESIANYFKGAWEKVKSFFIKSKEWICNIVSTIAEWIGNIVKKVANGIITVVEGYINLIIKAMNTFIKGVNVVIKGAGNVIGKDWQGINLIQEIQLKRFADGGFVDSGQLFIARESGAEMVGSIGGRTAVANNDQIVTAIKQGVIEAMSNAKSNVNVVLQGDTKKLFRAMQTEAKNYSYATGYNAF